MSEKSGIFRSEILRKNNNIIILSAVFQKRVRKRAISINSTSHISQNKLMYLMCKLSRHFHDRVVSHAGQCPVDMKGACRVAFYVAGVREVSLKDASLHIWNENAVLSSYQ